MKQNKWTIGGLLLPVVALLVLGFVLPRSQAMSKAPLSLGGFTVKAIPIQQRNRTNSLSPDTLVKIKIDIAQNFFSRRVFPMSTASKVRVKNQYLSDAYGVNYFWTVPANSLSPRERINTSATSTEADGSTITYYYELNLAQYPKSADTITFHAIYTTDKGFQLPVSGVVRK